MKNETNTFEIFSDHKLRETSIKTKINEHLTEEYQKITDKCVITRSSKKQWNIKLIDKNRRLFLGFSNPLWATTDLRTLMVVFETVVVWSHHRPSDDDVFIHFLPPTCIS